MVTDKHIKYGLRVLAVVLALVTVTLFLTFVVPDDEDEAVEKMGVADSALDKDLGREGKAEGDKTAIAPPLMPKIDYNKVGKSGLFLGAQQARKDYNYAFAGDLLVKMMAKKESDKLLVKDTYVNLALAGKIKEAAVFARQELAPKANDFLPLLVVVTDFAKEQKYAEALALIKEAGLQKLNRKFAYLLEGWLLAGEGKVDEGIMRLENLKNDAVFKGPYFFHKGLIYDWAGKPKEAEENYNKILDKSGKDASIRTLQVVISFYRRNGEEMKAAELLKIYKAAPQKLSFVGEEFLYPKDSKAPVNSAAKGVAETILGFSTNFTSKGEEETAILMLNLVLYLDPDLVAAKVLLAEVYENKGLPFEAVKVYESLPAGNNIFAAGQLKSAELLMGQKQYDKAEKLLLAYLQNKPDDVVGLIALGDFYREQKMFDKAIKNYSKAIEVLGDEKAPPLLFAARGMAYEQMGKYKKAEKDLLLALEKDPDQPHILNYLGYTWLTKGEHIDKAKEMIADAVQKYPDNPYIIDSYGYVFYLLGDYPKAIALYEVALEYAPAISIINDHLGDAYWKSGRKREAFYQWEKAIRFNNEIEPADLEKIKQKKELGLDKWVEQEARKKAVSAGGKDKEKD